jgi:PAB1-binding protein PBP1
VNGHGNRDAETFGGEANKGWDQFETNARLFGTTSTYKEELYTTKLNRTGPDFAKRAKEAEKLASEILGVSNC